MVIRDADKSEEIHFSPGILLSHCMAIFSFFSKNYFQSQFIRLKSAVICLVGQRNGCLYFSRSVEFSERKLLLRFKFPAQNFVPENEPHKDSSRREVSKAGKKFEFTKYKFNLLPSRLKNRHQYITF